MIHLFFVVLVLIVSLMTCCISAYGSSDSKADIRGIQVDIIDYEEQITPRYAIDILNDLPAEVEVCYLHLKSEVLALESSNPAEYGAKVCR